MNNEIDWSKAPEGATHYEPPYESGVCGAFVKTVSDGSGWRWWNGSVWQCHLGMTKERRSTLIDRPKAWTGTGLPPVGTVCEIQHESLGWTRCEIVAHKVMDSTGVTMAIAWIDANTLDQSQGIRFRPIRTQAKIEAEERERALKEIEELIAGYSYGRCAELIYDAGYRKTEAIK